MWTSMVGAVVLVVAATVPHDWQSHSHWARVAWLPFLTGLVRPADLLVNALLYLPLGLALQARTARDTRWQAALVAALLSVAMECSQVWSHDRFPTATDTVMNVAGCLLGVTVVRWHRASRAMTTGRTPS